LPFNSTEEPGALRAASFVPVEEWSKRFPIPAAHGREGEIEVRQMFELEDFGPSESIERFREMGVGTKT